MAAPVLITLAPSSGPASGGTTVTITGTNLSGATQVNFGSTPATSFTVVSAAQIQAVAPHGSGPVSVTVVTSGGTSNGLTYTYPVVAPTLTGLSPASGPVSGGNTVTITGTNLAGVTQVKFGSTPATSFTVASGSQVNAVAPPGAPGTVQVTVTTSSITSNGLAYAYLTAPVVTAVSPDHGPAQGGNMVTIIGSGLSGLTGVQFGGVPATSFTVVSSTQINAVVPPGPPGAVQVTVTTPGGTSGPGIYYFRTGAPALSSLTPSSGPTAGGNNVLITGSSLALATAVQFGAASAAFTVLSDSTVDAVAPLGSGTVAVGVTTPGGPSNSLSYLYLPLPLITSLNPQAGPEPGGTSVIISGSNLASTTSVDFGSASVAFYALSDTQLVATAPPGTGSVAVVVTTLGGTSNSLTYAYGPPPG
jgi:hypothetical protein